MAADRELVPEALLEQGGVKVSKSPWGADDEIGRLNCAVAVAVGSGVWVATGDPPYSI